MRCRVVAVAALVLLLCLPGGAGAAGNSVAGFLEGAECQYETGAQKQVIAAALGDMLRLAPPVLRERRYADYAGRPGAWGIVTVLRRYFVPRAAGRLEEGRFFRDVPALAARAAVRRQLARLGPEIDGRR